MQVRFSSCIPTQRSETIGVSAAADMMLDEVLVDTGGLTVPIIALARHASLHCYQLLSCFPHLGDILMR